MTTQADIKHFSKNFLLEVIENPSENNLETKIKAIKTCLEYFINENALSINSETSEIKKLETKIKTIKTNPERLANENALAIDSEIKKLNNSLEFRQETISILEKETRRLQSIRQQTL